MLELDKSWNFIMEVSRAGVLWKEMTIQISFENFIYVYYITPFIDSRGKKHPPPWRGLVTNYQQGLGNYNSRFSSFFEKKSVISEAIVKIISSSNCYIKKFGSGENFAKITLPQQPASAIRPTGFLWSLNQPTSSFH